MLTKSETSVHIVDERERQQSHPTGRVPALLFAVAMVCTLPQPAEAQFTQQGYALVGTGAIGPANQGYSVSLSSDGNTAIVGGANDSGGFGAAWIFTRGSGFWAQQGNKLAGNGTCYYACLQPQQGYSVALSADGNTALMGAPGDVVYGGGAWVYVSTNGVWSLQQGNRALVPYLSGTDYSGVTSAAGWSVALSADGSTAIVGGPYDNNYTGAAWVFTRFNGTWTQQGPKLVGTGAIGTFVQQGYSVALSADGNTAIIGGPGDNSSYGAAWVFTRSNGVWSQVQKLVTGGGDSSLPEQGWSVAISGDGGTALVGAPDDNRYGIPGVANVWVSSNNVWGPQAVLWVPEEAVLGYSVSLSGDGNTAIVGAPGDNTSIGAAWEFSRFNGAWTQGSKLVGSGIGSLGSPLQGSSVAVSADGHTIAVGARGNDGGAGATWVYTASGSLFVPMPPCRVVDTRDNTKPTGFGSPFISGGTSRSFVIPSGPCGIPATAQAYSLNVTVVPHGELGYLTVWPTGQSLPLASTLNSLDGEVKANAAIVPAGSGGAISVYATNDTDLVLDINGYFVPNTVSNGLGFYPITPCRLVDTRPGAPSTIITGALTGGTSTTLPILSSSCNVPATAQAYSLNFTIVPPGPVAYLTVYPTGESLPIVSTLNDPTGAVQANAAIAPAGTGGSIEALVTQTTNLVVDINGYFAPAGEGALSLYALPPCRVLDTRNPPGSPPFVGAINVNVIGAGCGGTSAAQAYVFNATVVPDGFLGYLTLWPEGSAQPLASTLNAYDGDITSNMAIVPTSNTEISAFATSNTYLILDIFGYFAP